MNTVNELCRSRSDLGTFRLGVQAAVLFDSSALWQYKLMVRASNDRKRILQSAEAFRAILNEYGPCRFLTYAQEELEKNVQEEHEVAGLLTVASWALLRLVDRGAYEQDWEEIPGSTTDETWDF